MPTTRWTSWRNACATTAAFRHLHITLRAYGRAQNKAGDVNRSMLEELLQGECFGTAGDRGAGTLTALPVLQ